MNKTMCPGQDTRYWRPGDIFDVDCGTCGASLEFFKDDSSRRCSRCGTRVQNPRLSMGCARWCEHARECLGYDPDQADAGGADRSVSDKILSAIETEFGEESPAASRAHQAHDRLRTGLNPDTANPGIVIPALLLIAMAGDNQAAGQAPDTMKKILFEAGVAKPMADEVYDIINSFYAGAEGGLPELRVLREFFAADHSPVT